MDHTLHATLDACTDEELHALSQAIALRLAQRQVANETARIQADVQTRGWCVSTVDHGVLAGCHRVLETVAFRIVAPTQEDDDIVGDETERPAVILDMCDETDQSPWVASLHYIYPPASYLGSTTWDSDPFDHVRKGGHSATRFQALASFPVELRSTSASRPSTPPDDVSAASSSPKDLREISGVQPRL
jgi:hypothetical protein